MKYTLFIPMCISTEMLYGYTKYSRQMQIKTQKVVQIGQGGGQNEEADTKAKGYLDLNLNLKREM